MVGQRNMSRRRKKGKSYMKYEDSDNEDEENSYEKKKRLHMETVTAYTDRITKMTRE